MKIEGQGYIISETPFFVDGVLTTDVSRTGRPWAWLKIGQPAEIIAGASAVYVGGWRGYDLLPQTAAVVTKIRVGNPYEHSEFVILKEGKE